MIGIIPKKHIKYYKSFFCGIIFDDAQVDNRFLKICI